VSRELYEFGDFRLDPAHRTLEGPDGVAVALTAKPFDALIHLVEHAGQAVSRAELTKALWPNTVVEDNNLTQAISALRGALGNGYIATLPGRGYQFVADVRTIGRESGTASPSNSHTSGPSVADEGAIAGSVGARWLRVAAAVVVIAVAVLLVGFFKRTGVESPAAASQIPTKSIAVLPFENLSPDADNAFYAAGLHEEIVNRLSKLKNLNVISRASALRFAENPPPLPEIAKQLNVETLMQGSVRFEGGRIRVAMNLIDARSEQNLWSETYDSNFSNVFGVQSDIATNVANAMSVKFSLEERADVLEQPTGSSEAYALYLRAWNTGGIGVRNDELLDRALAIDPDFALAHALKAIVVSRRLINIAGIEAVDAAQRSEVVDTVRRHATRAIELDPNVPYAHAALGALYRYQWHWTDAIAEYHKAIEAVPSDLSARQGLAWSLAWAGRHEEGIREAQRGIDLNPLNANALYYIAPNYAYAGDYESAINVLRRAQQLIPTNPVVQAWIGFMETALRNRDVAIRELRRAEEMLGPKPSTVFLPELIYAYSLLGFDVDVQRLHALIMERAETDETLGSGTWVQTYLAIGDYDRALERLEIVADEAKNHVIDEGVLNIFHLKMNYMNDPVLREPRFVEVFDRITGD